MPSNPDPTSAKPRRRRWARLLLGLGALLAVTMLCIPGASTQALGGRGC